jgi:hypothetical protein
MRRYKMLIAGLLMVGPGAYMIFKTPQALPLWFVWLVGPFLWYVGMAVSITGIAVAWFLPGKAVAPTRSVSERVVPTIPYRQVPIEVLLLQIENHVRLEQAAAESFLACPTQAQLHSKTTSAFVN